MAWLRREVTGLLNDPLSTPGDKREKRIGSGRVVNHNLGGDDPDYVHTGGVGIHNSSENDTDHAIRRPKRDDPAMAERICRDDKEATDLIDAAEQTPRGRPRNGVNHPNKDGGRERTDLVSNVNEVEAGRPRGNGSQYAIRRLRKDRPDLHAEVVAGAKSPHAATCGNGFVVSVLCGQHS